MLLFTPKQETICKGLVTDFVKWTIWLRFCDIVSSVQNDSDDVLEGQKYPIEILQLYR